MPKSLDKDFRIIVLYSQWIGHYLSGCYLSTLIVLPMNLKSHLATHSLPYMSTIIILDQVIIYFKYFSFWTVSQLSKDVYW